MYAFDYERPASMADALAKISAGGQALAGGQTLIASLKQRLAQPSSLIDLAGVAELSGIKKDGNSLVIGAMTRHETVADSADVKALIPALAALAGGIGDRQVRAMGTMGGSVANNDPAACYPSAVLGLGATVQTNKRTIAADDFFQGMYTTALEEGELITAIHFPAPQKAAYAKFRQPASRFALVGVFVAQTANGVRVAITGAGNGVFRHAGLEAALTKSFTPEAVEGVAIDANELNGDLHASAAFRAQLVKVQTQKAVKQANG
ncbi:carbon monoxide dehydrogenase [Hydrogenophaga crassostreae]|uniref:Carbon monoxide dehydrogenase n=1 Tax=Hydrogenophaga crassostreae TaxID=1763535 RepID=A0A167I1R5_9BURK|nr:xanthine dehydrogenase family protein subunit M [Hydrogenophaga crassostreae]AOW13719.1 carbon monoxide dehydrogenase [Hydrogenophaga crassostreae]OAD42016.1 carbon monoxide dehydrogenase [Hydrogenophaga crassostreae]